MFVRPVLSREIGGYREISNVGQALLNSLGQNAFEVGLNMLR